MIFAYSTILTSNQTEEKKSTKSSQAKLTVIVNQNSSTMKGYQKAKRIVTKHLLHTQGRMARVPVLDKTQRRQIKAFSAL